MRQWSRLASVVVRQIARSPSARPLLSRAMEEEAAGPLAPSQQAAAASTSAGAGDSSSDGSGGPGEENWKPVSSEIRMVEGLMRQGVEPKEILAEIAPGLRLDGEVSDDVLWRLIVQLLSEPEPRAKLPQFNSLDDAVELIRGAKKILVLTGAGISVSCGIPDFRSKEGIYSRLHVDYPDLPSPEAMFDIHYFRKNPRPFFQFAKEIYPGQFKPSLCHRFIRVLEERGQLLRNYTQNIDTLEQVAGIERVVQCHGSFATASCAVCRYSTDCEAIRDDIFAQRIPRCPRCPPEEPMGILKPDIVFFGEDLPEHFHQQMTADKDEVDLLIVIGSSLKVRPVALIPSSIPPDVPQILLDIQPLRHLRFDVELLGYCDYVVDELLWRLGEGYRHACSKDKAAALAPMDTLPEPPEDPPSSKSASPEPKRPRLHVVQSPDESPKAPSSAAEDDSAVPTEEAPAHEEGASAGPPAEAPPSPETPFRPPRSLGALLEADSFFYDERRARTLFKGCVVYESDSDDGSSDGSSTVLSGDVADGEGEDAPEEGDLSGPKQEEESSPKDPSSPKPQ